MGMTDSFANVDGYCLKRPTSGGDVGTGTPHRRCGSEPVYRHAAATRRRPRPAAVSRAVAPTGSPTLSTTLSWEVRIRADRLHRPPIYLRILRCRILRNSHMNLLTFLCETGARAAGPRVLKP